MSLFDEPFGRLIQKGPALPIVPSRVYEALTSRRDQWSYVGLSIVLFVLLTCLTSL